MSIVMRTLFPSKRRKTDTIIVTETEAESTTTRIQMTTSTVSLSGLMTSGPSSSAPVHSHRRQHSTGSYGLPPHIPRASTRRRESNNNLTGMAPASPIPITKMCTQSGSFLSQSDMRMVLIEAEQRVLYDTLTVIPVRNGHTPNAGNLSPCKEFQFLRRRRDTKNLSQMLFGAIPTSSGSESFKIHMLEDEDKILVSKSFIIPRSPKENGSDSDSQSTLKSVDGWRSHITQSTTSTPETFSRVRHISLTFGDDDNDVNCGASTAASSMTLPARAFSPPHRLSRNRRRQMAVKTSLSEISSYAIPSSIKSRSRLNSIGSQTDDEQSTSNGRKVALGLLFPASQRFFIFQHMPLIEAEMSRFETRIVTAAGHPPTFLHNISYSWDDFAETVCCLHNAPRLKNPVWLALNEKPSDEQMVSKGFCEQLAQLVRKFDNKESKYFISNVLTAVLMHHMSWVASVASPPLRADRGGRFAKTNDLRLFGMPANEDAQHIGYNAQMAQYLEVLGSCGSHKSAKFVICGEDAEELATICQVLSYFIRCSAVQHIDTDKCWELPTEQAFSPINASDTPDSAASPPSSCNLAFSPPDKVYSDEDTHLTHSKSRKARNAAGMVVSPSSSVDSLPSVVTHTAIIVETGMSSSITIIDRLEYPCCHSSTDEEDDELELWSPRLSSDGLGRSLFAGPLPMYCHHFVVSGLMKNCVDLGSTISKMYDEVRCNDSPSHRAVGGTPSISSSQSSSSVGESQMPENVLVVADVEDLRVKIVSSDGFDEIASPSEAVVSMLEQFMKMYDYGVQTSCIMSMIEDSLANVVSKSTSLVEIVAGDGKTSLSPDRVCQILECDYSDLRLIVNVAAVYWPPVLSSFGSTPLPYH